MKRLSTLFLLLAVLLAAGCKTVNPMAEAEGHVSRAEYAEAAAMVEQMKDTSYYKEKNALLYNLDYGILCHYAGKWDESNKYLHEAEFLAEELYTKSLSREIGSYLLNDKVKEYAGEDYEKVYIHIFKCLNYMALNDRDAAMVEIRKANLRMQLLEDRYRKEVAEFNNSEDSDYRIAPVKNHFHNSALSRYLGTILYRQDNAYDDARIEAEWMERAFLEQKKVYDFPAPKAPGLRHPDEEAFLDVIAFSGLGPIKTPLSFTVTASGGIVTFAASGYDENYVKELITFTALPIGSFKGINVIRFEIPVLSERTEAPDLVKVRLDDGKGTVHNLELLENLNNISNDTYKRKLPYTVIKTALRVAAKKIGSEAGEKAIANNSGSSALGLLGGLIFDVVAASTEGADLRGCFFMPAFASAGEISVAPGTYDITVEYYRGDKLVNTDIRRDFKVEKGKLNLLESFSF